MLSGNWFGKRRTRSPGGKPHRPLTKGRRRKEAARGRALRVEELEDRRMLATYIVNNLGDLDTQGNVVTGSLRHAVELSNASADEADTIVFADFLFAEQANGTSSVIQLDPRPNGRQLRITDDVQILGPGPGALVIQAAATNRIFETEIDDDDQLRPVTIAGVTLTGGSLVGTADDDASRGGAIFNREALTLIETVISFNSASQGGGAIYMPFGSLFIDRSLITSNSSGGGGGAILNGVPSDDEIRPSVTVLNSTVTNNSTSGLPERPGYGGGIYNRSGRLDVSNSTFVGNSASDGGGGIATNGVTEVVDDPPPPIVTSLSHNILFGNTGVSNSMDNMDDVFAIRFDLTDMDPVPLAPTLLIDGPGLGFNFIGRIGGTEFWDPNDETNPGNGHFYQVVSAGEDGIFWTDANNFTNYGQPPFDEDEGLFAGSHLATIPSAEENTFIFEQIDDLQFWSTFQPDDTDGMPPMTPPPELIGPWFGARQLDTSSEPADGWEWLSTPNEVFADYNNWADMPADPLTPVQPNDGVRPMVTEPGDREHFASFFAADAPADTWGDLPDEPGGDGEVPIAYVIEYDQGTNFFNVDPLLVPGLVDVGGSTPVLYPGNGSPIIDAGDPGFFPQAPFEQRGRHFSRIAGGAVDIGAVEAQQGIFVVDSLDDEEDRQYSPVYRILDPALEIIIFPGYDFSGGSVAVAGVSYFYSGDFSLREAIDFAEKNPGPDIIHFETAFPQLLTRLDDPTFSTAPTIALDLATVSNFFTPADPNTALSITQPVTIFGPTSYELEIDASSNDPTPGVDDNEGTRIFSFNNFDATNAIDVSISNLTLLGGDVVNNGGAILNAENLFVSNSTIKDNAASNKGGGIFSHTGDLVVDSSTLSDNRAGSSGGGIFVDTKFILNPDPISAFVQNSTLSGNIAGLSGAALYNRNGEVLIEYSTITENDSPIAAGVASAPGADAFTRVRSSIIAGNLGDDITLLPGATNILSLGFNLIGVGNVAVVFTQIGDHFNVLDPMLGPLTNTGGLASTHRPLPGSPAIDAGSPIAAPGVGDVPEFDQRGNPFGRVVDGLQSGVARIDIGAYEAQGATFVVDSLIDENDGFTAPGFFSLREAIEASNANPFTDTITFDPSLISTGSAVINQTPRNDPFFLLQGDTPTDIRITDSVNIVGLGASVLFLDGTNGLVDFLDQLEIIPPDPLPSTRFFTIDDNNGANRIDVSISGLTFINSVNTVGHGGAIFSIENLTLDGVGFVENRTLGDGLLGGAVYQSGGTLVLDGAEFTANSTDGVGSHGGALYATDLTFDATNNTRFVANRTLGSDSGGAGFYANNSTVTFENSSVATNSTVAGNSQGAGVYASGSTVEISGSFISTNSTLGAQSRGTGFYATDSNVTIRESTIISNRSVGTFASGAGIFSAGGTLNVIDSLVDLNRTDGSGSGGAGIAGDGATILVERTTVKRGSTSGSDAPGGGISSLNGNLTVRDSTISGNTVGGINGTGGGIFSDTNLVGSQKTTIFSSTISGNTAGAQGGGLFNADGLTEIKYSTITDNNLTTLVPYGFGSGVASFGSTNTRTEVRSSIIAGNESSDVDFPGGSFDNSFVSLGYNVIGNGLATPAFNASGDQTGIIDPMLGGLANNGGPTNTHRPQPGSPAIDTGDPLGGIGIPATDQRGSQRVQGVVVDIGAIETSAAADFDEDGDVDGADFLAWQRGYNRAGVSKSDGDANNDGNVDGLDLGIWQSDFGVGPAALSVASVVGDSSAVEDSSEPLAVAAVLSTSTTTTDAASTSQLTGLTLSTVATVRPAAAPLIEPNSASTAKDKHFEALSPLGTSPSYAGLESSVHLADDSSDVELEVTVEDRFFELLGSEDA